MPLARNHMSRSLLTVEPGLGLKAVAERMVAKDVGAVLVIDNGRLVGILTERDIMRAVAGGITDDTLVSDWMTRDPVSIAPESSRRSPARQTRGRR